jgi:hypothetical protein
MAGGFESVDGADVRVAERRQHARLSFEPRHARRIREDRFGKNLDRDVSTELRSRAR